MPPIHYTEAATPCPAKAASKSSTAPFTIYDENDDTAAVDFTLDVDCILTRQSPRRVKRAATFKIHEDPATTRASGLPTATWRKTTMGKTASSLLGQPAQRLPGKQRVSFAPVPSPKRGQRKQKVEQQQQQQPSPVIEQVECPQTTKDVSEPVESKDTDVKETIKRDRRRGTIYIPPDDTTMPTMFMSIFSPLKADRNDGCGIKKLEAQIAKKREQRRVSRTASPRGPLMTAVHVEQESAVPYDVAGSNTGKENVPPGASKFTDQKDAEKFDLPDFKPPSEKRRVVSAAVSSTAADKETSPQQKAVSRKSKALQPSCPNSPRRRQSNILPGKPNLQRANERLGELSKDQEKAPARSSPKQPAKRRTPTRSVVPRISIQKYPVLTEDISNPRMYEENWLAHQEIVITQLVNGLFDSARGISVPSDADSLRHELLEHYQDAYFSLLFKRVQASLLYGALRIPKDVLQRGNRLKEDVGMRRKFLDFWLTTYHPSALRAAAETVVGRRISTERDSLNGENGRPEKVTRRALEAFLDTFLIRNEDRPLKCGGEGDGVEGSPYCRTVLRGVMMILLLDKARLAAGTSLPRCLFLASSSYKSSAAALQALMSMLNPTVGDVLRPLSHIDCQVGYEQYCLQEYEYRIKNLAVDLRDGVLLTRLVELLLFLCEPESGGRESCSSSVTLPTGQVLSLVEGRESWPLSQHLKVPCNSRATKVFNVQVALSALCGVRGVGMIAKDLRPEDIVDGYREKTIALLWGLVGKWGLPGLLDWDDLKREIRRLESKILLRNNAKDGGEDDDDDDGDAVEKEEGQFGHGYEAEALLLRKWASCLAELKGIRLANMTTSFAGGRIFESIVDEYEVFILADQGTPGACAAKRSLAQRLRGLGCSSQFGERFISFPQLVRATLLTAELDRSIARGSTAWLTGAHFRSGLHAWRPGVPVLAAAVGVAAGTRCGGDSGGVERRPAPRVEE
ncbi:hypothetical protein LOZ10_006315 [Ophidiomyces ophidiicola]|nr:hypothetical protein LOZ10_006315 [Ophidiomyces ophidiicola]